MRLFVAIDLDENARRAIGAEQSRLMESMDAGRTLRWVKPADMHLTLVFIGDLDASRAAEVVDAIGAPVDAAPFGVSFAGLGVFPPRGAPSVLWLGVSAGGSELVAVQSEIAERLQSVGIARESRPYLPHLTLARWRTRRGIDSSARRRAAAADSGAAIARISVDSVVLYQSQLSSSGPKYSALARAPLRT